MSTATGEPVYIRFQRRFNRYRFHYEHQDGLCFYCCQPMPWLILRGTRTSFHPIGSPLSTWST